MIIHTEGDISPTYVQTLCLLFFPGSAFSPSELPSPEVPELELKVCMTGGGAEADACITLGERRTAAKGFCPFSEGHDALWMRKLAAGDAVLRAGGELTGIVPPWGILTGVRPTKIACELIAEGCEKEEAVGKLTSEYRMEREKAELLYEVAYNELVIIARQAPKSCGLYISVPFCPTRCAYCSFVSYSTPRLLSMLDDYTVRLCSDIKRLTGIIRDSGMKITTAYIGGGTPTTLNCEQLERLLGTLSENVDIGGLEEYTLEGGRPDTITAEKMRLAVKYGVTRTSVNPQTLSDEVLERIGRRHTAADFFRAYEITKNAGFRTVNTDLIAGLPGDSFDSFRRSCDGVLDLEPENFTCHTFAVKRSSELKGEAGIYRPGDVETAKCVSYAQKQCAERGYIPYYLYRQKNMAGNLENTGYSLPGHEGLYNIYIMEETCCIFAAGAGGVTKIVKRPKDKMERYFMPKYPYEYLEDKSRSVLEDIRAAAESLNK